MSTSHNVAHFLTEQAEHNPHQKAVRAPKGRNSEGAINYIDRSFAELEGEASCIAYAYQNKGIRRGTRVLLMVEPGLDLIRTVFALFKIGAVPIVIDPGMGFFSFLKCVRNSKPKALIGIPFARIIAAIARKTFKGVSIRLGPKASADLSQSLSFPVVDSEGDELAAVLFTSGSTGPAKGVCYTHGMFAAQVDAIRTNFGIQEGERDLPMLPVFALFNPALGMCTVVPEINPSRPATVDPRKIIQAIQENKISTSFGSPTIWALIAEHCELNDIRLPEMKRILLAGASVPPILLQHMKRIFPNAKLHTPYGATEALPMCTIEANEIISETAGLTYHGAGICVGRPLPNVKICIIEPTNKPIKSLSDTPLAPPDAPGEIIVQGPTVTKEYDNNPEATAHAKIQDGNTFWHRMGDLGQFDEEGRLWFCGRQAECVQMEDRLLYTDVCEAITNQHPKVFRSALIDRGNGTPALVIQPKIAHFPKTSEDRSNFEKELKVLCESVSLSAPIEQFFFEKRFPVDIRHNAKINRLQLAKKWGSLK